MNECLLCSSSINVEEECCESCWAHVCLQVYFEVLTADEYELGGEQ